MNLLFKVEAPSSILFTSDDMIMQVGDIGTKLIVQFMERDDTNKLVASDISDATTQEIFLETPAGVVKTLTAAFDTDGRDGKIVFTTISGTIDSAGTWKIAGHVVASGLDRTSRYRVFTVETPLA